MIYVFMGMPPISGGFQIRFIYCGHCLNYDDYEKTITYLGDNHDADVDECCCG